MRDATRAVHAGQAGGEQGAHPIAPAIQPSVTYYYDRTE
jgi:hypothetical protein